MDILDIRGEAFNLLQRASAQCKRYCRKISKLMDSETLTPIVVNEVSNEIKNQYLSSEKAQNVLDWKPQYTLDQGLLETIHWYKEYFRDVPQHKD